MKGLDGFELYNNMRNIDENVQVCFYNSIKHVFRKVQESISWYRERVFHTKANYD